MSASGRMLTRYDDKIVPGQQPTEKIGIEFTISVNRVTDVLAHNWITQLRANGALVPNEPPEKNWSTLIALGEWNDIPTWEDMKMWIAYSLPWSPRFIEELTSSAMVQFGLPFADDPSIQTIEAEGIRLLFRSTDLFNEGDHVVDFVCLQGHETGLYSVLDRKRVEIDIKLKLPEMSRVMEDNFPITALQATALSRELFSKVASLLFTALTPS